MPSLTIKTGRLQGVAYKAARVIGSPINPSLIVLHDTAGRLTPGSSVEWFQSQDCKTSAHVVIELDGTIIQMVPFDRKAAHAGQSSWNGKQFCNSFSIGIEIVNPGCLDRTGKAWFGQTFEGQAFCTKEHGDGCWMPYTEAQINALIAVCRAIAEEYEAVNEIVGHYHISPGRKVDPNPLFPWDHVIDAVFNHDESPAIDVDPVPDMPPPVVVASEPKSIMASKTMQANTLVSGLEGYQTIDRLKAGINAGHKSSAFDWFALCNETVLNTTFWIGLAALVSTLLIFHQRWKRGDLTMGRH